MKDKKTDVWQVYPKGRDAEMLAEIKERYNIESTTQIFRMLLKKEHASKK